ncbi:Lipopolysaccharide export system ATP-binding protein LptB [Actinomadura madurae]|nr:Lipopolysaccharide export system ATP-binding protein LptB [Actinomadura madurae]
MTERSERGERSEGMTRLSPGGVGGRPPQGEGMTERSDALVVDGLAKRFGGLSVLGSVALTVPSGTIFGIAGPNGAGKTTLLNIISGLLPADGGSIRLFGEPCHHLNATALARLGIARTFQNIRLLRGLTVVEQVMAGAYRNRRVGSVRGLAGTPGARAELRDVRERALACLGSVGLRGTADRLAETLPYGDQRRLEIARALVSRPRLLLLDEPTAGMNAADWTGIGELVSGLRGDGTTVVVVEHNMRMIETVCDQVAVLASGEVIACDEPVRCLRRPDVRRAYFGK